MAEQRGDMADTARRIAVIGMSGRFPGAPDLDRFWEDLLEGRERVTRFTDDELDRAGVPAAVRADPGFVPVAGVLAEPAGFDAGFFGLTPAEAAVTDPQQRLFLECAWEAVEAAGYAPAGYPGRIGVFAGASGGTYRHERVPADRHPLQAALGSDSDMLSLRVSYKLGCTGPSLTVQTACSSALVAVHLGVQSLLSGECDLALAGGASVRHLEPGGHRHEEGGIVSRDGHCRPFDAAASGTVGGDGVGVVVMKRLDDAIAEGDQIHAVVLGSAVNNDGASRAGFTAPSPRGQAAVVAEAIAVAGINPAAIGYLEAHGTATPLGDPIEVQALTEVFGPAPRPAPCLLGSVKANIGHLDAAAGIAGFAKAVLVVKHGVIPPAVNFTTPNPAAGLAGGPFRVNTVAEPWPMPGPRRAGVSAFGMGGTNAHVVLEEAPSTGRPKPVDPQWMVLALSARSAAALDGVTDRLAARLAGDDPPLLADVAYTLRAGRTAFAHRRAVVVRDRADAVRALATRPPAGYHDDPPPVVFMLPGQGSQYTGMGAGLYAAQPEFRAAFDACVELAAPHLDADLREVTFTRDAAAADRLRDTKYTQPAMFAVDYALAQLLLHRGVRPAALIGHSLGEYVAACLAGVLTLADAVRVVAIRGRLMRAMAPGGMLAVAADEATTARLLAGRGVVAAINGPAACVVAGTGEELASAEAAMRSAGLPCRRVRTLQAFHSPLVEPVLPAFGAALAGVPAGAPRLPVVSNLTGTWLDNREATDPAYWLTHTRRPVRFGDGVALLRTLGDPVLVEVGPGRVLTDLARAPGARAPVALLGRPDHTRGPSDRATDEERALLAGFAALWQQGVDLDPAAVDPTGADRAPGRRRVRLPTYPFERRTHLLPRLAAPDPAAVAGDVRSGDQMASSDAVAEQPADPPPWAGDELTREVAEIWREVLGIDDLRPDDDFLHVGGNSLLAIQLMARLRERFGELPMSVIFEHPTVAGVAEEVRAGQANRLGTDGFDELLREIETLSPDEVRARLGGGHDG